MTIHILHVNALLDQLTMFIFDTLCYYCSVSEKKLEPSQIFGKKHQGQVPNLTLYLQRNTLTPIGNLAC